MPSSLRNARILKRKARAGMPAVSHARQAIALEDLKHANAEIERHKASLKRLYKMEPKGFPERSRLSSDIERVNQRFIDAQLKKSAIVEFIKKKGKK